MKKKLFFLSLLLITSASLFAQDKKSLEERANKMFEYTNTQQYEKMLDLTYPKLFTIATREQMVEALGSMSNGDGFRISLENIPPNFRFGELKKIDGGTYCVITHDLKMKMFFDEPIDAEEQQLYVQGFKEELKAEEVVFDEKENSFTIKKKAQMVAIADAATKNEWTFLNNEGGPLLDTLLGEKVKKELGL